METATKEITNIQEKRSRLKELSAAVTQLVKEGRFEKVNEAIIATFYRDETHREFRTFWQWIDAGYRVKKGSKAFYVWAKPLSAQKEAKGEEMGDDEHDFYPLCFLFSDAQVEPIKKPKT